jgi:hypothetical protein
LQVAYLATCRVHALALQEHPVGHDIIKRGVKNAAVGYVVISAVMWTGCEGGNADLLLAGSFFEGEGKLQPDRI